MGIYPLNAVVNAFVLLPIRPQLSNGAGPRDGVLACATEIRKSLEKLKDPRLIEDMAASIAKVQSRIAWDRGGYLADPKEGCLVVNITRRWVSDVTPVSSAAEIISHLQIWLEESTLWTPRNGQISQQSTLMPSLRKGHDSEPKVRW